MFLPLSQTPRLLKAKQDAEAKGYIFETSHDEIVAKAKKEGRLKVLTGLDPASHAPMMQSFKKKYPFIDAVEIHELDNTDASQRFLTELKAGRGREWDVAYLSTEVYSDYPPLAKKFDFLGMAEQGVLKIPPQDGGAQISDHCRPRQHDQRRCVQQKTHITGKSPKPMGRFSQARVQGKEILGRSYSLSLRGFSGLSEKG